jgi:hypothetical protein
MGWRIEIQQNGVWKTVPPADYSLDYDEAVAMAIGYANARIISNEGQVEDVTVPGEPQRAYTETDDGGYGSGEAAECGVCEHEAQKSVPQHEARRIGDQLGVDWRKVDVHQFARGLVVEQEHEDVTRGDPLITGRIALAHLKEDPAYYTKLDRAGLEAAEDSSAASIVVTDPKTKKTRLFETRGVLAGAYGGGSKRGRGGPYKGQKMVTHAYEVTEGKWGAEKSLCGKITADHLNDEDEHAWPSCKECAKKLKKLKAKRREAKPAQYLWNV